MSEAKKYDRSYKEQSVKLALEIGVKRAGEELKVPYGTLYGWVQAAKNGDLDIEERTPENAIFLNKAAAFSPRAVVSKQAGANEVHCAQNLRWRRKRQDFILLQSAENDTAGSKCISRCSLNIRIPEYQVKPRYTA